MDTHTATVLFANGSAGSWLAVEFGADLLASLRWPVRLIGIQEGAPGPGGQALRDQLSACENRLREAGLKPQIQMIPGNAPETIIRQSGSARLAIFGPLGRSGLRRLLRGRTIRSILQAIECPTLYVHSLPPHPSVQHLLICSGGLGYAEGAVRLGGQLAAELGAQVTLLHVSIPFPALPAPVRDVAAKEDEYLRSEIIYARALREDLEILRDLRLKPLFRLRRGDPLIEIMAELRSARYDLVAIGSHSAVGPLAKLVGDITHRIAERANLPVLVVKGHSNPP